MQHIFIGLALLLAVSLGQAQGLSLSATGGSSLGSGNGLPGQSGAAFLPVEQAYQLSVTTTEQGLSLQWRIADGYFLYRHGFKAAIDGHDLSTSAILPEGIAKTDELFGAVQIYYQQLAIQLPVTGDAAFTLDVQSQGCSEEGLCYPPYKQRFEIDWPNGEIREIHATTETATIATTANLPGAGGNTMTLPLAALFAFLGGLILNLMPCVLPVLSLKAIGLASSHDKPAQRIAHGWWYTLGIVASFCAIASVLIALKSAGSAVGWGFQLQSSWFVAALVYLFLLMALLLAGAADFSGQWMGFGQSLASGGGYRGSFFTGTLAVLVASPCTAPFMGTAMGFALAQGTAVALLVFICLGLGMAAPFLLLSYLPRLGRWLPKPGAWMERFREFLAFPLLATAIWLLWVIARQTGADGVALVLCGCLLIAVALWFNGGSPTVKVARLLLFTAALALLASPGLRPTSIASDSEVGAFSEARVEQLRAEGKPVFVNFTADWCLTCIANEHLVLSKDEVIQAFKQSDVAYLKADWTNYDPAISASLENWGRSGIPLYLFYPADSREQATVLPQILSVELLLETLGQAGNELAATQNLR
jgi:thiol:disulfide interchange protein